MLFFLDQTFKLSSHSGSSTPIVEAVHSVEHSLPLVVLQSGYGEPGIIPELDEAGLLSEDPSPKLPIN